MKLKFSTYIKIFSIFFVVITISFFYDRIQAMSVSEAGKYVSEFAINFYNNHKDETGYTCTGYSNLYTGHRAIAYLKGEKTMYNGMEKYWLDCVGWVSFAYHHSLGIGSSEQFGYFATPQQNACHSGFKNLGNIPESEYMPGDILVNSNHVMLYVGNNTIIDSAAGDGVSPGLKKRAPKSTSGTSVTNVVRMTESFAGTIDSSNATTIFQGSGGLTNAWIEGEGSAATTIGYDNARIVDPDDKLPLYKHILLSEKYNFNSITWNRYGHGDIDNCTMKEDLNLGLKYPDDNNGVDLNKFIDFSLPYLQSWLIPLSMYSGAITSSNDSATSNDTQFAYMVLKEAMSRIIANKYDIETCVLTTKFKEYTVYEYKIHYTEEGSYVTLEDTWDVNERLENPTNLSSNIVPLKEDYVGKRVDIDTEYHIQEADTFDLKLNNTFKYIKYNEYDVGSRINAKIDTVRVGESIYEYSNGGGDDEQYGMTNKANTYYIKKGFVKYVDRTWQDEFEQTGATVTPYKYNDVKQYNNQYLSGNAKLDGIPSDWLYDEFLNAIPQGSTSGSRLEDIRWLFPYAIAASKGVNGQILPSVLVAQAIGEGGWGNISAAKSLLLDSSAEVNLVGKGTLFGQSYIPGYGNYPTIKTTGTLKQIEAYVNNLTAGKYEGYNNAMLIAKEPVSNSAEEEYKSRAKSVISSIGKTYCGYDESASEAYVNNIYSYVESYNLWKLDQLYDNLDSNGGIDLSSASVTTNNADTSSDQDNNNVNSSQQQSTDISKFTNDDEEYYAILETNNLINRVDLVNSKSSNYFTYLLKGEQYSNHVGYSRSYLVYSYSELKDKLEEFFEDGTLPYYYGASLGYSTYTDSNYIKENQIMKVGDNLYVNSQDASNIIATGTASDIAVKLGEALNKNDKLAILFPNGVPTSESQMESYLTTVNIPVIDKSGNAQVKSISIHKSIANDVVNIFTEIAATGFKAYDIQTYNWRYKNNNSSTKSLSSHAYGLAIDINPNENCQIINGSVNCGSYYKPGEDQYSVTQEIVNIFAKYGWTWGGNWTSQKDYMHFSLPGD